MPVPRLPVRVEAGLTPSQAGQTADGRAIPISPDAPAALPYVDFGAATYSRSEERQGQLKAAEDLDRQISVMLALTEKEIAAGRDASSHQQALKELREQRDGFRRLAAKP